MSWPLFSLVLTSATGGALLALGSLPVRQLREIPHEPVKAAVAWIVVASTAPPAVFHWYLIFAVCSLIAWTRLDRPAGKVWLALTAALGLSLGLIFPLETSPALQDLKNPLALALLYLGGATIGQAYTIAVLATPGARDMAPGRAVWLFLMALAWTALFGRFLPQLHLPPSHFNPPTLPSPATAASAIWPALAMTLAVPVLALLTWTAARRQKFKPTRGLAIATTLGALAAILLDLSMLRAAEAGQPLLF